MSAVCSDSRDHVVTSTAQSRAGHREIPQTTNPVHVRHASAAYRNTCTTARRSRRLLHGHGAWSGTVALRGFRALTVCNGELARDAAAAPLTTWTSSSLAAARETIIG